MEDRCNDPFFENNLSDSFLIQKCRCKVLFHQGWLTWEKESVPPDTHQDLSLNDVIAVSYKHNTDLSCCYSESRGENKAEAGDCYTEKLHFSFIVHYTIKEETEKNWQYKIMTMTHSKSNVIRDWVVALRSYLKRYSHRPKRLIAFINPNCGKNRSTKIYKNVAKPLFDIAEVEVNEVITERANQARDFMVTDSMDGYDGAVCVGGDGTFSEVMNGLIIRTAKDRDIDVNNFENTLPKPQLRIGIIPCGSTDAIAYSIHGTIDIITTVLYIIKGECTGMDVSSVHSQNLLLRYYACLISYGYLGDTIRNSNNLRWMGPKRYDFSGFKNIFANRGYEGEIQFAAEAHNVTEDHKCFEDCLRCKEAIKESENDYNSGQLKKIRGKFLMVNGANMSCACPRSPNGISPHCHKGDGCLDLVLVKHTSVLNNFRLLFTLSNKVKTVYDLPFVEVHRTRQFAFHAIPDSTKSPDFSVWNCDGEIISSPSILITAHCQLLRIFSNGIEASFKNRSVNSHA